MIDLVHCFAQDFIYKLDALPINEPMCQSTKVTNDNQVNFILADVIRRMNLHITTWVIHRTVP